MELKTYFAQDASGNIMPGATVTVYEAGTATLATGLQDESGSPLANPFTADSSAKVAFYAPDGLYDITVVGNGRTVTIRAQFVSVDGASVLRGDLAATGGSVLVGSDDGDSGSLWTTVAGFIAFLLSSLGASVIGFIQAGVGAIRRSMQDKARERVSVLDFGADPAGATDSTAAFNLATLASVAHGGNDDLAMRREIYVPPGDYLILGTVYVRKGQTLRGAGDGSTRITTTNTNTGRSIFKMGFGLPVGVETQDPGGLPVVISDINTLGGDSSGGVVDMQVPGAQARNLFITSAGVGIRLGGADTIVSNCIIEQGLTGISLDGQNHIIDSCLFYNLNYGIGVYSNTFDVQVADCHFEYGIYDDVLFNEGAANIKNVTISDCQFVKNAQYATSDQAINIKSNSAEINIRGCEFRNQRGYSINIPTGVDNRLRVSDCSFNGLKTNPTYDQSTTAAGINAQNGYVEISDCRFENLFGNPIRVSSTIDYPTVIKGCTYRNISTATSFVTIEATTGELTITDCIGDGVLPLINLQSNIRPRLKNNRRWLGAAGNAGGRFFWKIPTTGGAIATVGVTANPFSSGNLAYRGASAIMAARSIGWNGSAVTDYASKSTTYETPSSLFGVLDIQVELDAVGGGANAAYSTQGRYLVVSVPNAYYYTEVEADFVV